MTATDGAVSVKSTSRKLLTPGGTVTAGCANVAVNPRVAVLVEHYADDWNALWWVRADGRARVLDRSEPEAVAAIALLAARYPQQRASGAVLALDVERWTQWSARASN